MIEFMNEANIESLKNLSKDFREGGPFGAVVVKDNEIIGRGHNQVIKNNDPTAHAEVLAIRDACKNINSYNLEGCTLYTSCYPCPMCLSATIWSNIKDIYYGNTREDAEDIGFRDDYIYDFIENKCTDNKIAKLNQMQRDKTIEVFYEFKKLSQNNNINY